MDKKRVVRTILGLLGVVIFGVFLYLGGKEALVRIVHGDPVYILATILAIGGVTIIGTLRWRLLVSAVTRKPPLPFRQMYHYTIIGRFVSLFAPRGIGDFAARPLALTAGGGSSFGMAVYSTILDRIFDYFLMIIMTIPSVLYVAHIITLETGAVLTIILVVVSFFIVATNFGRLVRLFNKIMSTVISLGNRLPLVHGIIPKEKLDHFQELESLDIDFQIAGTAYVLTVCYLGMMIVRSYFIALALGITLSPWLLLLAAPVAQLGQLLAFTPGALGIRELSWFAVLQASGIPTDDLLTFLVGQRAYITFSILVLAFISQLITIVRPVPIEPTVPVVEVREPEI